MEKGIFKFSNKAIGIDADPFPKIGGANVLNPDLSRLSKPRVKIDLTGEGKDLPRQREGK